MDEVKSMGIMSGRDGFGCFKLFVWTLSVLLSGLECNGTLITEVKPHYGSTGGATKLSIFGSGFSKNQFTFNNDPDAGNQVYLISTGNQYRCPVIHESSSESIIVCYTPSDLPETTLYARVVVDGILVDEAHTCGGRRTNGRCSYRPRGKYTPLITNLTPYSGLPGTHVTINTKLNTDEYVSYSFLRSYDSVFLSRVYVGPSNCDLENDGQLYGLLELYRSGSIQCKTGGTSVGFYNASFVLDSPFGRSLMDASLYRVSYNNQIYIYQIYTEITYISHVVGSVAGGLALTIYGKYFDDRPPYAYPRAYIADTVCEITEVVPDDFIVCTVAAEQDTFGAKFQGNRGVMFEYWTSAPDMYHNLDDILSLSDSDIGYNSMILDETYFKNDSLSYFASRMTSFFIPHHTGEYQFFLMADGDAKLFLDGDAEDTSLRSDSWKTTERVILLNNTRYLIQIVQRAYHFNTKLHLKVKHFGTSFTTASVGKAEQEEQTIQIRSTVSNEIQKIRFSEFTVQSYVHEVQTVDIDTNGEFRFGIYGVYTEPLMNFFPMESIQSALDELPIWGIEESVTVIKNETNPQSYQITFNSKRGDFPDVEVVPVPFGGSSAVLYNVSEDIRGIPDLDTVALVLDGIVSEPFSVASLDAGNINFEDIVLGMFDARCPDVFENHVSVKYYESFENGLSWFDSYRTRSTDAFCGKYILQNPNKVYQRKGEEEIIALPYFGTMCFAYKGAVGSIRVSYAYVDFISGGANNNHLVIEHSFSTESLSIWHYTCVDLNSEIAVKRPMDYMPVLETVVVYRPSGLSTDIYIDSVSFGRQPTTDTREMHLRRLRPALSGKEIDEIDVIKDSPNTYEVTLKQAKCVYTFPLFELANSQVESEVTNYSASTLNAGDRSAIFEVNRILEASPPVTGSIDMTFNGKEKRGLNVSLDKYEFKTELETLEGIGAVKIEKNGDCYNFDIKTKFLTLAGDLPTLEIKHQGLHGKDVSCIVTTNTDGGLFYDPLTGDMVSTVHDTPQVRLYINDVPTTCSGDCSFNWDQSVTPTVTSVNPTEGNFALQTSIVIHGSGFSDITSKNNVTVGDAECLVTASDSFSITCDVGSGSAGSVPVLVQVDGKGFSNGNVEFIYTDNITTILPEMAGLGGGVVLTIDGFGFRSDASVMINNKLCAITSLQKNEIQCIVPPSNKAETFEVVVVQGSSTLSYTGFKFDSSLTAEVISVSPQTLSVLGGPLKITGSSFTSSAGLVSVGMEDAAVGTWSDTEITVSVPAIDPGIHEIGIKTPNGFAVNVSDLELPTVYVEMSITDVYPRQGSLHGGTKLTVSGNGFGSSAAGVKVTVGTGDCTVSSVNNTQILCDIDYTGRIHHVTNKGIDPAFGVYYAFDKPYITINEGDFVHWSWETPAFVNDIAHSVIEVESPSSLITKPDGINSGKPSRNGYHIHRFNQAGTYYIWSGFVDIWNIKNYVGTVEVVHANSTLEEINVLVGNKKALHILEVATGENGPMCESEFTVVEDCEDTTYKQTTADKFFFAFCRCSTPVVNMLNVNNGTTLTDIEISGQGFSYNNQENDLYFETSRCNIISSTENRIVCNFARTKEPQLGMIHRLELNVYNRGFAQINIRDAKDSGFALLPNVENINPISGSLAGGTRLTITGFGFGRSPIVLVDHYECVITDSSDDHIYCETPPSYTEGNKDVEVFVYLYDTPLKAVCETNTSSMFSYNSTLTPVVYFITPFEMSKTTSFYINGTLLGDTIDDTEVTFGGVAAKVEEIAHSYILITVENIAAGENDVVVKVDKYGKAQGRLKVNGILTIYDVSPSSGSIYGGSKITIQGNGFVKVDTYIKVGGVICDILSTSLFEVTCRTHAHHEGAFSVEVSSNRHSTSYSSYYYSYDASPTITRVDNASGYPGDTITIYGSNLGGTNVTVFLGQSVCDFINGDNAKISCTVGNHSTGLVPVSVYVPDLGASNTDVNFNYQLSISSIAPPQGSTGGGQEVVITGAGIDSSATVTICGKVCLKHGVTFSSYSCKTSAHKDEICDVVFSSNGIEKTLPGAYSYNDTLTPSVTNVIPRRGGTGGGTTITITGSGFEWLNDSISVEIDGTLCNISNVTDTEIECVTGPHVKSVIAKVEVVVAGYGIAKEVADGDLAFQYIDIWSSVFTWGGGPLPQEGEFVVIPTGATILLDIDTPVMSVLLIQGHLIFDEKDIELQSNIIIITDGGHLQVGTERQPFQQKAVINLHGHVRSKELPVYGTKVLAVRNGTLDLHGIPVSRTWTRLASTALAGDANIYLVHPVDWKPGDKIAISSTGNCMSQCENEKRTITAISEDKRRLTLHSPLQADHISSEEDFEGISIPMRAEVGLLTHNIVVRGNTDTKVTVEAQQCKAGEHIGHFTEQTCNHGRVGDDVGSSQFGGNIIVHTAAYNSLSAQVRISYTEIKFAGQTFRQGRHPVYFRLNGDMSTSYISGCSIHNTFNRAINIQGSHNILVEKTVLYNIMGIGVYLEDGIETGNIFQYNLVLFIKSSSRLSYADIVPAAVLITNPNNTIQHNAVAGGTHCGFLYNVKYHPDGPSFTRAISPRNIPLGIFRNNSAHSFRESGLRISKYYFPRNNSLPVPAHFENVHLWNNYKGVEVVNSGPMHFEKFVLVQNEFVGYECSMFYDVPHYKEDSPLIKDSIIIGTSGVHPSLAKGCTKSGIILPYGRGFRMSNVTFVNFATSSCAALRWARIKSCSFYCGGFTYTVEQLNFINVTNIAAYVWDWEGIIFDKDGTATGKTANWTILPSSGSLPSDCEPALGFSAGIPASMCPPQHKWHRFAFHDVQPWYLRGKHFIITNEYGNSSVKYASRRLTHDNGWMCDLLDGSSYTVYFDSEERLANLSFYGRLYDFEVGDYIFFQVRMKYFPDRVSIGGRTTNVTETGINITSAEPGDWGWNREDKAIQFVVKDDWKDQEKSLDVPVSLSVLKCLFKDCKDPNTVPPEPQRPFIFEYWHDTTIWNLTSDGYMTNVGDIGTELPQDYDNVKILMNTWVLVNRTDICKLGILLIEGVLEFSDFPGAIFDIEADFIIIKGGRMIIGWLHDSFDGLATITLRGNKSALHFDLGSEKKIGPKAIGVYGGLDLIGKDVGITWTQLSTTANKGSRNIVLIEPVEWKVGDEIVISSTSVDRLQSETFRIISVLSDNVTLTLNASLRFKHIAHIEAVNNKNNVSLRAAVGLLTRNIKVVGQDERMMYEESFGARILVDEMVDKGRTFTGYTRVMNVEFYHTGQDKPYDSKMSLLFLAPGRVSGIKPSIVTQCSFHHGFSTAVGAKEISHLEISRNVIFGHHGHGIMTGSFSTVLNSNLVVETEGNGIEAINAKDLTLENNYVTGAGTVGYHIPVVKCGDKRYRNNKMYSNVIGGLLTGGSMDSSCVMISGFTSWKSYDIGLYYIGNANVKIIQNELIENQIGLFVVSTSKRPIYANTHIVVQNTTFIGQTSSFDCLNDNIQSRVKHGISSAIINSRLLNPHGMFGIMFSHLSSMGGVTTLTDVTFSKYSDTACKKNYAVTTNVADNYNQAPTDSERVTLIDVSHSNKIIFQRPENEITNNCVNLNCAAFRYVVFRDLDGSFLGHPGSVIPESEYGKIDECRVPIEMITDLDGKRIPLEQIAPKEGIVRNDNCIYRDPWQAYECFDDFNYEFLRIRNMDDDARTRQVSPVALLSDGYIDLLYVPQDHIKCNRYYTCKQRKSTFYAMVATGQNYLMHFTGTTPRHIQYTILHKDPYEGIKLTVWYSRPNRLDVFVDGTFVIATNARIDPVGRYILTMPIGNEYEPQIFDETGTNYFDRTRGEITVIIKGPALIDVVTQDSIIVSFGLPALTVSEFFGENIIENLAAFFDIPLTKVRIVNIVSELTRRRYKRSASSAAIEIEIGDEPVQDINSTLSDSIDLSTLIELASLLSNECQLGNISQTLNFSLVCETIGLQASNTSTDYVVYETVSPSYLFFHEEPEAGYEGASLKQQPTIRTADIDNNIVPQLGTIEYPWHMTVTLRDDGSGKNSASLSGTVSINSSWGWFNFTDLVISDVGSNFVLDFNVTSPEMAKSFSLTSKAFDVNGRPLKIDVHNETIGDIFTGDVFEVELELRDKDTDEIINNIAWRNHTWSSEVDMLSSSLYGSLDGIFNTTFDISSGRALFSNLSITGFGIYFLKITVLSDPPEYNLTLNHRMTIKSHLHVNTTNEETAEVKIKFGADFEDVLPTVDRQNEFEQAILTEYANTWNTVELIDGSVYEGSISVVFVITGSKSDVMSTVYDLCDEINNETLYYEFNNRTLKSLPYLSVNDTEFYGVKCGAIIEGKEDVDEEIEIFTLIAISAGAAVFLLAAAVICLIWRHIAKSKQRIHDSGATRKYSDNGQQMTIEDILSSEDVLEGSASKSPYTTSTMAVDSGKLGRTFSNFSLRIDSPDIPVNDRENKNWNQRFSYGSSLKQK